MTPGGDYRLRREDYVLLQEALSVLMFQLQNWNHVAKEHGVSEAPYGPEAAYLASIVKWGSAELADGEKREIVVSGISVGSLRYQKAALLFASWAEEERVDKVANTSWPKGVMEVTRRKARRLRELAEEIKQEPAAILDELRPLSGRRTAEQSGAEWDVFISHAREDKEAIARPLKNALTNEGLKVWYDEDALTVGDSLRRSIDRGLAHAQFGIVILSPRFLEKEWPQRELDGLAARESDGRKVILPVWHEIDEARIRRYSPMLADRIAVSSASGIGVVVRELLRAINR